MDTHKHMVVKQTEVIKRVVENAHWGMSATKFEDCSSQDKSSNFEKFCVSVKLKLYYCT